MYYAVVKLTSELVIVTEILPKIRGKLKTVQTECDGVFYAKDLKMISEKEWQSLSDFQFRAEEEAERKLGA